MAKRCGRAWRGGKGVAGRASNLISIITKESRGYRYRRRNIFLSNGHTEAGIQIASLLLSFIGFLSLFLTAFLASFDIFELAWQWFFTVRQSVPRSAVHILINIRVSGARIARASPIVPPRLWVSIKINIRTRVSSHRKYAAHPSCNRRDCSYIGSRVSMLDRKVFNIVTHWWSLRNYSNRFFDVDLIDFSRAQRDHAILHAIFHSLYISLEIYLRINVLCKSVASL